MVVTNGTEYSRFLKNVLFGIDSEWFEDFKAALAEEDIRIMGTTVCPASESHFVTSVEGKYVDIPSMSIYAAGDVSKRLVKDRYDLSHPVVSPYEQRISDIWRSVCIKHGVDTEQYCGVKLSVSVVTVEHLMCDCVIRRRECISEVEQILARRCIRQPRNIYCSSIPAYNIVFTKENYDIADIDSIKEKLTEEIRGAILQYFKNACSGFALPFMLEVHFWHPEMQGYNGYGLARQD